jgi:hypothetical protein
MKKELDLLWKEAVAALLMILSVHLAGDTKAIHEDYQSPELMPCQEIEPGTSRIQARSVTSKEF